jgi:hypothetical protein
VTASEAPERRRAPHRTDIDFRTERRREFLGAFLSYTTEGQQKYRLIWRRWLHHQDLPEGA